MPGKTLNRNKGFSLIEVLVSLLILSIGLLGVASMQVQGLKFSHDAYLRTQISMVASDIIDRMRLNPGNAANYVSNYTNTGANNGCVQANTGAANDLNCWHNSVESTLPPGLQTNVTFASSLYTVSMIWTDRDNTTRTISYTFLP